MADATVSAPPRTGHGSPLLAMVIVTAVFGYALFNVDQLILDNERAAYQTIRFIQGTFDPLADAQRLYAASSVSHALDAAGSALPEVSLDGKIKGYDPKLIDQVSKDQRLRILPNPFAQAPRN